MCWCWLISESMLGSEPAPMLAARRELIDLLWASTALCDGINEYGEALDSLLGKATFTTLWAVARPTGTSVDFCPLLICEYLNFINFLVLIVSVRYYDIGSSHTKSCWFIHISISAFLYSCWYVFVSQNVWWIFTGIGKNNWLNVDNLGCFPLISGPFDMWSNISI